MVRMSFSISLQYDILDQPSDFIFNIHAAKTEAQTIVKETLFLENGIPYALNTDPTYGTRYLRLKTGPGRFRIGYQAMVDMKHHLESPEFIGECPIAEMPSDVLPYLYPSRYCQSDRLHKFASREFGHLPLGYGKALAIRNWVNQRTVFLSGSTTGTTSAVDTLTEQVGVCRDFAHLMIALCRAVNLPARFVSGIDYGANPALGPSDFHAYVEVFLGSRWYIFDPSGVSPPLGLVRLGTGRDAADASFATIFGSVASFAPSLSIYAHEDVAAGIEMPLHTDLAVSS